MYYFKCPNCGSNERFTKPQEQDNGLGGLILIFGGLIPALIYGSAKNGRVQCGNCGFIFRQPSLPGTSVSTLAWVVIGIVFLCSFATFLMLANPGFPPPFSESGVLANLEEAIAHNPRAVVAGILPMAILVVIVSLIASWVSNRRAHRELRENYETEPQPFMRSEDGDN